MNVTKEYIEPDIKNMAIVIPYFNFCNSKNIKHNLVTVMKSLENANIPFYVGEVYYYKSEPFNSLKDNIFIFQTDSYMFYKENIVNNVIDRIKDKYEYICILDADIIFDDINWYNMIKMALEIYEIVQPFSDAFWLYKNFKVQHRNKSIVENKERGHPGFSLAFRTKWFKENKLFDLAIIGGGDRSILNSVLSISSSRYYFYTDLERHDIKKPVVTVGNVKMKVYHLYHGNLTKRQYDTRTIIILDCFRKHKVKYIADLVYKNYNGIYQWKEKYKEELNKKVLNYFSKRNDDE